MGYRVLTKSDAAIIAAMGSGVIPRGGRHFTLGAADLEDQWLARTDYLLARMTPLTRVGLKMAARALNILWPLVHLRKLTPLTAMEEEERTELFHLIENSRFPGPLTMLVVKVLVFPAFYGLDEVKEAIGYRERYPHQDRFEGLKD